MKKEIARLLVLMVLVVAVSWALVKFVKVVHAGCCQYSSSCLDVSSSSSCWYGTYYSGYTCCSSGYCASSCTPTTTCKYDCSNNDDCNDNNACTRDRCIARPDCGTMCTHTSDDSKCDDGIACTVDKCTSSGCTHTPDNSLCDDGVACTIDSCSAYFGCSHVPDDSRCSAGYHCTSSGCEKNSGLPDHGQLCTKPPGCKQGENLACMSGGCNGEYVCCYNGRGGTDQEYAYCDDPPGGVARSYCHTQKGDSQTCHYCVDLSGDHYNVGDCVTTDPSVCSSGWLKCTDTCDTSQNPAVYEWGCVNDPASQCPQFGGAGTGTGGSTTTTTIPYDVLSVSYASLHNEANPAFPALHGGRGARGEV